MKRPTPIRITLGLLALLAVSCSTDTGITARVKAELLADEASRSHSIEVTTRDGVVTLTGNIDSQEAKNHALQLARDTSGVRDVVDMIAVKTGDSVADAPEPPRTLGEHIDDAEVTLSVKAKLFDDPLVRGSKIDVDTRQGVVFLTGPVRNRLEKDRAVELAKATRGVRKVEANLTVES